MSELLTQQFLQAAAQASSSMIALQRSLKEQRDRNERLTDDIRDERAVSSKLRIKLSQREDELRTEMDSTKAAARERVRPFQHANRCSVATHYHRCMCACCKVIGSPLCHVPCIMHGPCPQPPHAH
jgi:Flp pilus assembly protein TadB